MATPLQDHSKTNAHNTVVTQGPSEQNDCSTLGSTSKRQPLTESNLAAHNASMSATSRGPTPMQRWYLSAEDRSVRDRSTQQGWDALAARDEVARDIEQIFQSRGRQQERSGSSKRDGRDDGKEGKGDAGGHGR